MIIAAVVIIVAAVLAVTITMNNAEIILAGGETMMPTTIIAEIIIMMAIIAGTITSLIAREKEDKMVVLAGAEGVGRILMNLAVVGGTNLEEGTVIQPIVVDNRSTLKNIVVMVVDLVLLSREKEEGARTISWILARSHHRKKMRTTKQVSSRR